MRQYVRRHSIDFGERSPSGRLRRSSIDGTPPLPTLEEAPAAAEPAPAAAGWGRDARAR